MLPKWASYLICDRTKHHRTSVCGTKLPIWDVPATGRDQEYPGHALKAPR
jgi:hypothetical protein